MSYQHEPGDRGGWSGRRPTVFAHQEFPPYTRDIFAPLTVMLESSQGEAACKQDPDPDRWFDARRSTREQRGELGFMRRLCASCPLRAACLHYALTNDVTGIWAGTNYRQRERMRKEQGIVAERLRLGVRT